MCISAPIHIFIPSLSIPSLHSLTRASTRTSRYKKIRACCPNTRHFDLSTSLSASAILLPIVLCLFRPPRPARSGVTGAGGPFVNMAAASCRLPLAGVFRVLPSASRGSRPWAWGLSLSASSSCLFLSSSVLFLWLFYCHVSNSSSFLLPFCYSLTDFFFFFFSFTSYSFLMFASWSSWVLSWLFFVLLFLPYSLFTPRSLQLWVFLDFFFNLCFWFLLLFSSFIHHYHILLAPLLHPPF